jgi:hypothetical protein
MLQKDKPFRFDCEIAKDRRRGRCYDDSFLRYFAKFLAKKLAFLTKTKVMIKIIGKTCCSLSKKMPTFSPNFSAKII